MSETMSMLFRKEIAILDRHLDAGVITPEDYRERVAQAKAHYSIGGTQPPTSTTTATSAAAPRRSAKASLQMGQPTKPQKSKCKWGPMELPEPVDSEGNPITEGLSTITIRAIEGSAKKYKKGEKWEGSGLPGGKIGIGTGYRSELTLTPAQFLQLHSKMEEIYNAVMGTTDADGNEVAGLLDDSQPREILVL